MTPPASLSGQEAEDCPDRFNNNYTVLRPDCEGKVAEIPVCDPPEAYMPDVFGLKLPACIGGAANGNVRTLRRDSVWKMSAYADPNPAPILASEN